MNITRREDSSISIQANSISVSSMQSKSNHNSIQLQGILNQDVVLDYLIASPVQLKMTKNSIISQEFLKCFEAISNLGQSESAKILVKLAKQFCPEMHLLESIIKFKEFKIQFQQNPALIKVEQFSVLLGDAVSLIEELNGPNSPLLLDIFYEMSILFRDIKSYQEALDFSERAEVIAIKVLGRSQQKSIQITAGKADLFLELNDLTRAIQAYKEALSLISDLNEFCLELKCQILYKLSNCLKKNGSLDEAIQYSLQGSSFCEKHFGPDHCNSILFYTQLASISAQDVQLDSLVTKEMISNIQIACKSYERIYSYLKKSISEAKTKDSLENLQKELLQVIKQIIILNIQMLPPTQKSMTMSLRKKAKGFSQEFLKDRLASLLALSPSNYVSNLMLRINQGDLSAEAEYAALLHLVVE